MSTGAVKWFNTNKGYGFIEPQDGSKDVFVHINALEKSGLRELTENQKVDYEIENHQGKASAINIKVVG